MRRPKMLYVHEFKDRHGKVRRYFRRPGFEQIALPGLPGSEEFMAAYQAALGGAEKKPVAADKTIPGSISAAVVAYLKSEIFAALSDETRRTRRSILERFRADHGHRPLKSFTRERFQIMVNAKAGTPDAAKNFVSGVRAVVKFARSIALMKHDPTAGIERPKIKRVGFHTWTEEEIAKFEDRHPIGTKPRLAMALLLYTAQRRQDVIRMGQQHRNNGLIKVRQRKTGRELEIPMHPELIRVLDATPSNHLNYLTTSYGNPFTDAGFGNWMREQCNAAGLPNGVASHGLRKAACRRLAEAGCSEQVIMSISGHRNSKEVQIYVQAANQKRMAETGIKTIVEAFPVAKNGTSSGKP